MPAIVPNRYNLDYTGVSNSNLIENEVVTLVPGPFRAFSPLYSPYFKKNIHIVDTATGLVLNETQYDCYSLVASASAIAGIGNDVYSIVVVTDEAVSDILSVDYQTVGGHYTTGYESLLVMVQNLTGGGQTGNADPVGWDSIGNLPQGFPENLHLHPLGETVGWEYLAAALEKLKNAILLGDQLSKQFVLSYIDSAIAESANLRNTFTAPGTPFGDHIASVANPHNVTKAQLDLGFVENYAVATLPQAMAGLATDLYVTADQVAAVVLNQINLGMDAHLLDTANPHATTKAQVGLGSVMDYPLAEAADLNTPVSGDPKYVTNTVAAQWLAAYFLALNSGNTSAISLLNTNSLNAVTQALAAQAQAQAALAQVNSASGTIATATATANQAAATANQNAVDAQNSATAAEQLIQTYLAPALLAAENAAYAAGYAAGLAAP